MGWAGEEFATADLGDKRLNSRLVKLVEQLAAKPTASIPAACGGWGETAAAYRLLDNERCDWREIIQSHATSTVERMAGLPVVLCLHDTTELDFNGQAIEGLGPLGYEAQRGMYLHPTYAVSPDREPLGVLDAWMWAREPRNAEGQRGGPCESVRWVEGYERLAERAADVPSRLVQVGDRESDILALFERAQALDWPVDLLVRSQHNRRLPNKALLWDQVQASEPLGRIEFTLGARSGRAGRRARLVRQELRLQRVILRHDAAGDLGVSCLIASEVGAPAGQKPVCWRLLTNRQATTLQEARELIDWYRARWEIEMFFHVLKTGCRIEALQLATFAKIERALALFMVVAWRIARLMRLGRTCPELPASLMFEPDEIMAAYVLAQKPPPKKPPTLNDMIRRVASLGGFLARKGDGEPGVKTIWLGLQRLMDFAAGVRFMRTADLG